MANKFVWTAFPAIYWGPDKKYPKKCKSNLGKYKPKKFAKKFSKKLWNQIFENLTPQASSLAAPPVQNMANDYHRDSDDWGEYGDDADVGVDDGNLHRACQGGWWQGQA